MICDTVKDSKLIIFFQNFAIMLTVSTDIRLFIKIVLFA